MFVKLVFLNFRLIEDKFIQVHADESVQEKIASAPQLTRLVSHMAQIAYKFPDLLSLQQTIEVGNM